MNIDTTVDVDFIVPAIPAIYKDPNVFVRFQTMQTDHPTRSLVVEVHNNGLVSRAEVELDAYKLGWVQSWQAGNDRATDQALVNLLDEEAARDGL